MFPVTITITNMKDLDLVRAALYGSTSPSTGASPSGSAKPADKAPAGKVETTAAANEPAGKVYTIADAKALTVSCVKANKRAQIENVLRKYYGLKPDEAVKIPDHTAANLKPDQVAPYCLDAEKVLAS